MHRIYLAFLCFFRILLGRQLPVEVLPPPDLEAPPELEAPPALKALPEAVKPVPARASPPPAAVAAAPRKPDATPGALQLLALLQREGRLVDFLAEDISGYDDASIGAAVR